MKVLVVHPYGIGDVLFMTPLLRAIREKLSVEYLDVILGSRTKAVLENNPDINEIFVIDKDKWRAQGRIRTWLEKRRLYHKLKARNYDVFIDLSLRKEYAKWLKGLRIAKRIGFDHEGRGKYLNYKFPLDHGFTGMHAIEFYNKLAEFLGISVENKHLQYRIPQGADKEAEQILGSEAISTNARFITVSPGGGSSWGKDAALKQWPVVNFIGLINKMAQDIRFEAIIILGARHEYSLGEKLKTGLNIKAVNLCGRVNLGTAASFIKRSAFFLGNDSGLVHIAASLNKPLIAIYGPVDPKQYGPYPESELSIAVFKRNQGCQPCYEGFHYNDACVSNGCLIDLKPEDAYQQIKEKGFLKHFADLDI